ncbi:MAG: hypothetical protein JNM96_03840 [Bacteroidia bacterium]|nr:hypothetical protein [Bacteroidia bacterium]
MISRGTIYKVNSSKMKIYVFVILYIFLFDSCQYSSDLFKFQNTTNDTVYFFYHLDDIRRLEGYHLENLLFKIDPKEEKMFKHPYKKNERMEYLMDSKTKKINCFFVKRQDYFKVKDLDVYYVIFNDVNGVIKKSYSLNQLDSINWVIQPNSDLFSSSN